MSQLVLITGASSGFGRAIAIELAQAGCDLVLLARRKQKLLDVAEQIQLDTKVKVHCLQADVTQRQELAKKLSELPDEFKEIDVLVNNAGLALGLTPAQQSDWQDWQTMIETNCLGLAFITRQILPNMVERDSGQIINIGSTAAIYAYKGGNAYGATKAFVDQFSAGLRSDLLGTKVRVTNLIPGLVAGTEFSNVRFNGDDQKAENVYDGCQPLLAEDIARSVKWVIEQPEHMNVNRLEVTPTCQASLGLGVHKD